LGSDGLSDSVADCGRILHSGPGCRKPSLTSQLRGEPASIDLVVMERQIDREEGGLSPLMLAKRGG
jgi:hypothetical protein